MHCEANKASVSTESHWYVYKIKAAFKFLYFVHGNNRKNGLEKKPVVLLSIYVTTKFYDLTKVLTILGLYIKMLLFAHKFDRFRLNFIRFIATIFVGNSVFKKQNRFIKEN